MKNMRFRNKSAEISGDLLLAVIMLLSLVVTGCMEEESYNPKPAGIPELRSSSSIVVLSQKQAEGTAFTLTWTPGSNYGTNAAIDYTIQVDRKGNNFISSIDFELGKAAYTSEFKVFSFNDLLLNSMLIAPGEEVDLEFRVISRPRDASVTGDESNTLSIKVTPYEPVFVPEKLFMVGDAAPNGWDAGNATEMTRNNNDHSVFSYQGKLNAGELKFLTVPGEWLPSYQRNAEQDGKLVLRTNFDQPDEKIVITKGGSYKLTVDLIELTYNLEELASSPYSQLWIVGSATPKEWNLENADEMRQDVGDPFVFTFNEILSSGEFKIATAKSWDALFYRPVSNHPDISETTVQLSAGDPDHKWIISQEGAYKITLDLRENRIDIVPFTPFESLYIVGDATPAGWNIGSPVMMTRDNDYLFSWTGPLTQGEFKFPIATGDWGTGYFMPYNPDESITSTLLTFRPNGSPDTKFRVKPGEEGTYTIAIDQLRHTISIIKQ